MKKGEKRVKIFLLNYFRSLQKEIRMSSIFQAFTPEEVESIRSVVIIGQQSDDMLLTNCTRRPLAETRAFIRRFKKSLQDPHATSMDISEMANQQYVAIITAARAKKNMHPQTMSSAHSMMNLALPFANPMEALPLKFRAKFSRLESDQEQQHPKPAIPTRSRSVSNGLNQEAEGKSQIKINIPVVPSVDFKFPHAVRDPNEITPGDLAAVIKNRGGPTIICRVIALKVIDGLPHALVAFFLNEIGPCYVPLHHLVMLREEADSSDMTEQVYTVDKLLKKIMVHAQSVVLGNEEVPELEADSTISHEQRKNILFQTLACAAQLQLLSFIESWEIPEPKQEIILREVEKMCQAKFKSTEETNQRCKDILNKIISHVK